MHYCPSAVLDDDDDDGAAAGGPNRIYAGTGAFTYQLAGGGCRSYHRRQY